MRTPLRAALLAFIAFVTAFAVAAEDKARPAEKTSLAGSFAGTWEGPGDASGKLRLKLKPDGSTWAAEASFTFRETVIPTTLKSIKVDGAKVVLVFSWVIETDPGESTLTGELKGDKLAGTYETKSSGDPSQGTWSVTRVVEESKK
jgi:hypothetical protein